MKTEAVNPQEDQVNDKTNAKEAYKKPTLAKHESLRDITGQTVSGGVILK
jgi:hypothetical protein